MKASIAIQILPQVTDKDELVRIVDEVIDYIRWAPLRRPSRAMIWTS